MPESPDKNNFFEDINASFAFKPVAESGSYFLGPTGKVISLSILFPNLKDTSIDACTHASCFMCLLESPSVFCLRQNCIMFFIVSLMS